MLFIFNVLFLFSYVTGTSSFPKPLTAEEEKEYVERCAKGDTEAKNILIEKNLRLVVHIVKKYSNHSKDMEDLISVGTIGLIKAIGTYNPVKGTKLATYAARCIDNAMYYWMIHCCPSHPFLFPAKTAQKYALGTCAHFKTRRPCSSGSLLGLCL